MSPFTLVCRALSEVYTLHLGDLSKETPGKRATEPDIRGSRSLHMQVAAQLPYGEAHEFARPSYSTALSSRDFYSDINTTQASSDTFGKLLTGKWGTSNRKAAP